jgi:hypothetical protein
VEDRLVEVEGILQGLWFGWFDAIYRQDPDALWQVVATTRFYDAGVAAMDSMEFVAAPSSEGVDVSLTEILLDRDDCLVVHHSVDISMFLGPGEDSQTVSVLWPDALHGWRFATAWQHPRDLWLMDCDTMEREETP